MDDMVAIHLIEKLFGWIMKYLCCCHYILCTSIHPQQGVEASNSQEDGIFGDATPSPSETINVDDSPSADPNFSQDTGTGGEETWGEESFSESPPDDSSWTDSISDATNSGDEGSRGVVGSLWDWWNES
eukprot:486709_1